MGFQERLLIELKHVVAESPHRSVAVARSAWKRRLVLSSVAAAAAVAALVLAPTLGERPSIEAAYAVTESANGTVRVEIRSIEDAEGLERRLEEAGVAASVHYLPQDKLCSWLLGDRARFSRAERETPPDRRDPHAPATVTVAQSEDAAFVFTVDKSQLSAGDSLVVLAEHDLPEHGQSAETVASIGTFILNGDFDDCELADGSAEGWMFQEGARP